MNEDGKPAEDVEDDGVDDDVDVDDDGVDEDDEDPEVELGVDALCVEE